MFRRRGPEFTSEEPSLFPEINKAVEKSRVSHQPGSYSSSPDLTKPESGPKPRQKTSHEVRREENRRKWIEDGVIKP